MSIHMVQTSDPTHLETAIPLHLLWSQALKQRHTSHVVPLIQPDPKGSTANDSTSIITSQGRIPNAFGVKYTRGAADTEGRYHIFTSRNELYQDKGPQARIGPWLERALERNSIIMFGVGGAFRKKTWIKETMASLACWGSSKPYSIFFHLR